MGDYKWPGNPFISNLYFKTLASKPQYNLANGLAVGGNGWGVLAGDKFGRPLNRDVQGNFVLHTNNWWNTSLEDSGPWYFRPMTHNSPDWYDEDLRPRRPCFRWNYTTEMYDRMSAPPGCLSEQVTIDEQTGVQFGGPATTNKESYSLTFYFPYEMNFVMDFTVDEENHPRGCNIPDVYPECAWGHEPHCPYSELPINCPRNNFKLPGESMSSADIVDEFAYSHQTWAVEFLEGWQMIQKSGYGESLEDGPESSTRGAISRVFVAGIFPFAGWGRDQVPAALHGRT